MPGEVLMSGINPSELGGLSSERISNTSPLTVKLTVGSDLRTSLVHPLGSQNGSFVDWITISEYRQEGGLPILISGVNATFDSEGNCRFERPIASSFSGSFETSIRVQCDGFRLWLSGNVGRFGHPDNLFNRDWPGTLDALGRICRTLGFPPFTVGERISGDRLGAGGSPDGRTMEKRGAIVSRLDVTANYRTGSDAQARAVIRWLSGRSIARMKRGLAGDESVWFSNTRHMLKAYRKGAEMRKHGGDETVAKWCDDQGLVRVEVELKKRALLDLGLNHLGDITQEKLDEVFKTETEIFRAVDRSDDVDILDAVPVRSRAYAAAWLAGQDLRALVSESTLFRHARVLRALGMDILEVRNIERFPVRVRVVDLEPMVAPDWHWTRKVA